VNGTRPHFPLDDRFWSKVDRSAGPDACWPWIADAKTSAGYGVFHPVHGLTMGAHRLALADKIGRPLASDEFACHRCDNPPCCNPDHLFIGSHSENMADMTAKGRSAHGERKHSARLTDEQVIAIRRQAAAGTPSRTLAARHAVAESLISMIIRGTRWTHVGGPITNRYNTKKEQLS
jgi:hypothetical protein